MRPMIRLVAVCLTGLTLTAPATADDRDHSKKLWKEQKKYEERLWEFQKKQDEQYRKQQKKYAERLREDWRWQEGIDRKQQKRYEELLREQAKREREANRGGYPVPAYPPAYGQPDYPYSPPVYPYGQSAYPSALPAYPSNGGADPYRPVAPLYGRPYGWLEFRGTVAYGSSGPPYPEPYYSPLLPWPAQPVPPAQYPPNVLPEDNDQ